MRQTQNLSATTKEAKEKVEILDKYNDIIESIKWLLFEWLWYEKKDDLIYNKAYFSIWENISHDSIAEKVKQASEKIDKLVKVQEELENEILLNWAQKQLINKRISSVINNLEYHKNAIYIEAQKAWFSLTQEEIEKYNTKKLEIEQKLYWNPITKLEFRKNKVLEKLQKLYWKFPQKNLTDDEKLFWKTAIEPLFTDDMKNPKEKEKKDKPKIPDVYISEENIFPLIETLLQIEWFWQDEYIKIEVFKDKEKKEIMEEDWIFFVPQSWKTKEIYDYFNWKWLWQKFKIIKKNLGTNSVSITKEKDAFKKNEISLSPAENGKYNLTKKVLPVMFEHEEGTHVNAWIGDFFNLSLKDPERSDLEEGIGMANERFSQSLWLDDLYETSKWDVCQYFWEIFDDDDLKNAVTIYFKISWNNDNIEDRLRRIRMGVPRWQKWSRRSDLTYGNSKEYIRELEELTKTPEGIEMLNKYARIIYSTKLWLESIKNIDALLEGIIKVEQLEPNFPIFAGKIIYRKLFKGKLNTNEMLKTDLRSIIKTDNNMTYAKKKLLLKILQIIKQDSEYKKSIHTWE